MRRCLITGATGLIGSHLVRTLASSWEVHAVSRRSPAGERHANVIWHEIDLSGDFESQALPDRAEAVVYLAQSQHFRRFPERALDVFQVNAVSLLRLLDHARRIGAQRFIYASSGGVYGTADMSLSEELPVLAEGNLGFYLGSKLCGEILALSYASLMHVAVLRFFFVYGPGQKQEMLIPRLIGSVRTGTPVVLQGQDGVRLNPVYVSDAVAAVVGALSLERSCKVNIAGPENLSLRQICEAISRRVGRAPVFRTEPGQAPSIVGDIGRMRELLAAPGVTFEQGLARVLDACGTTQ